MPRIGGVSRIGSIGKSAKRVGGIGSFSGSFGSLMRRDLDDSKLENYPTTTTADEG